VLYWSPFVDSGSVGYPSDLLDLVVNCFQHKTHKIGLAGGHLEEKLLIILWRDTFYVRQFIENNMPVLYG
jgi:hypothetical protein